MTYSHEEKNGHCPVVFCFSVFNLALHEYTFIQLQSLIHSFYDSSPLNSSRLRRFFILSLFPSYLLSLLFSLFPVTNSKMGFLWSTDFSVPSRSFFLFFLSVFLSLFLSFFLSLYLCFCHCLSLLFFSSIIVLLWFSFRRSVIFASSGWQPLVIQTCKPCHLVILLPCHLVTFIPCHPATLIPCHLLPYLCSHGHQISL